MAFEYDSRTADKFVVRLPDGMRDQVAYAADADDRSMNSLIVKAIREYLELQQRQQVLLGSLMLAGRVNAAAQAADPRDMFIAANPIKANTAELEKGRSGFVDPNTHAQYLIFLAGFQAFTGGAHVSA
ncbi:Arc family DNA-binding protein [Pseudomonas mosselii]|uniref:Arc family DNA-binding protein n=1 Tax=Pseudomonas mosselii TaxID=78327 RepID=UPI0020230FDC|nr:Arc family DNA-binding protein [Pseudomonas mosselii]MCL8340122.1 Arc family DNA-binding protein [Pseudomonas mosselii]WJR30610.1 Arc family DNA-binding protein [Pseudomonas mosselii]